MPGEEPLGGQRLVIVARGVEHHLDNPFDGAVSGFEAPNIHSKTTGNRGSDLFGVELLPFNLAALEHVSRERLQHGFLAEMKAQGLHVSGKPPLRVANRRETLREMFAVPGQPRPVLARVDVHSPHLLRRLYALITARMQDNLRISCGE